MKKNKLSFETCFWSGSEEGNLFKAIDAFFEFSTIEYYKQSVTEAVMYCYRGEVYKQDNPSDVFVLYTLINSFLKITYALKKKSKNWKVTACLSSETVFHFSSLTPEEFDNPFMVFQKAFDEKTPEEFELFLCLIIEFSMSPYGGDPSTDITTPYIHLIKMLDAITLIKQRGVEKIKKMHRIDFVKE